MGVSRERVRQIERKLDEEIQQRVGKEIGIIAAILGEKLPPVIDIEELDHVISKLFARSGEKLSVWLAVKLVNSRLNYSCENGVCVNKTAHEVVETLKGVADGILDDVGLIPEKALRDHLPSEEWTDYFSMIVQRCGFHRVGFQIAVRITVPVRIKAALLKLGRPATTEEIAAVSRLKTYQVSSRLPSISSVARAGKTTWGLAEWIDDVYEGVTAEIIQRIKEDGGATPFKRLLEELPRQFGVTESSVRQTVGTLQFVHRDGYVSMADESSIRLGNLHDVAKGHTLSGDPYWTFLVEDRYFSGHSLTGFPPVLARELGCEPNSNIRVEVDHPKGCGKLSVSWRLSSLTAASLGYLADPLQRLGVTSGDRVRVIIKGRGIVQLQRDFSDQSLSLSSETQADYRLEKMKQRRDVI